MWRQVLTLVALTASTASAAPPPPDDDIMCTGPWIVSVGSHDTEIEKMWFPTLTLFVQCGKMHGLTRFHLQAQSNLRGSALDRKKASSRAVEIVARYLSDAHGVEESSEATIIGVPDPNSAPDQTSVTLIRD